MHGEDPALFPPNCAALHSDAKDCTSVSTGSEFYFCFDYSCWIHLFFQLTCTVLLTHVRNKLKLTMTEVKQTQSPPRRREHQRASICPESYNTHRSENTHPSLLLPPSPLRQPTVPAQRCFVHARSSCIISALLSFFKHSQTDISPCAALTLSLCCFEMWQADNQITRWPLEM